MVLAPFDDLLVHQTAQTLEYPATTDLRFFERFYFNVHDRTGQLSLITGLGAYPNMNSMDGFGCANVAGSPHQFNARFFRELHRDRTETRVGPLHFEVLEPMKRWHLALDDNPYDVSFDLEMSARFDPWETRLTLMHEVTPVFDMGHFVQSCAYRGRVVVDGKSFEIDDLLGVRDRSWGVRPLGGNPIPGNARGPYAMHFWINAQFDDSTFFVFYYEDVKANSLLLDGGIKGGRYDGRKWTHLEHQLEFRDDVRIHNRGTLFLTDDAGQTHEVQVERLLPGINLRGAGYGTTQGKFYGDHEEGERWDVVNSTPEVLASYGADGDPTDQLAKFTTSDGTVGAGMMEYSFSADYEKYPARVV